MTTHAPGVMTRQIGKTGIRLATGAVLIAAAAGAGAAKNAPAGEDANEIAALAAMLPRRPAGFGRPIGDRQAWAALAKHASYQSAVRRAEGMLARPIPASPDDLYLEFSRNGNRTRWQRVASRRRERIGYLTLAECVENKGRFLPALRKAVDAVCAERTWVMPAHDRSLRNFKGTQIDIDLGSAHLAWDLASADWLLGDKLGAETRKTLRDNLRRRILDPYLAMVAGKRTANWWTRTTNNWNAVCLAGVTGSALATVESARERARFVAAARRYSRSFLKGFTPDGYCSEGLGYWGYGFGHYVLLAEEIHQATGGRVDLLAGAAVRAPATYASRIEITGGVYPAFADCSVRARPSSTLLHFLARRLGLGADPREDAKMVHASRALGPAMMYSSPNSATRAKPAGKPLELGPRSWFPDAGVLICRPAGRSACRMGVALKGGHNAEHHNHNDVGSYVVVVGERAVLLDPGAEVYTARTFSRRRYESKVLNSFGHPVPRLAGKLQRTGRKAAARVVRTEFTDEADTLALDLRAAYDVAGLKKLQRTFVYSRRAGGSLKITDEVELARPGAFETALITLGRWQRPAANALTIHDFDEAVRVEIDTGGADFEIVDETIKEDVRTRTPPRRLGIRLKEPTAKAAVSVTITPVGPGGEGDRTHRLRNGGFEQEDFCWDIPADGMGSLSAERPAGGKRSLRIADASTTAGSNISSARIPAVGGRRLTLRGKVFGVSGTGVGLYVKFYDKDRRLLNAVNERGHISAIGTVGGPAGAWQPFALPFQTPPQTAAIQVWIHSANAARVVARLDDLEIAEG